MADEHPPTYYAEAIRQSAKAFVDRCIEITIFAEAAKKVLVAEVPGWHPKMHLAMQDKTLRESVMHMNRAVLQSLEPEAFQAMILGLLGEQAPPPKGRID